MTTHEQYGDMLEVFCCFITTVEGLTIDFNCFGFCSWKFTPETPEVHFAHPSIGIVVNS